MRLLASGLGCGLYLTLTQVPAQGASPFEGGCDLRVCIVGGLAQNTPSAPKKPLVLSPGPAAQSKKGAGDSQEAHPPAVQHLPTCAGNAAGTQDALCPGATQTCPKPDETRFWTSVSTWDPATAAYGAPVRQIDPPFVCLNPQQQQAAAAVVVDPRIATAAAVRAQWRTFGLPGAVVRTEPQGQTLAGAVTRLSTGTPAKATLPPKTVLGVRVVLRVTAVSYRWDFGDGAGVTVPNGGALPHAEHVYRATGPQQVSLRTVYSATFTMAGDPAVYPLDGTADVPGAVTLIAVREARTQLEAGPS